MLNLNISASTQNMKNLDSNFWAIHVIIMHTHFQASSSRCGRTMRWHSDTWRHSPFLYKISKLPPHFAREGWSSFCCSNLKLTDWDALVWVSRHIQDPNFLEIFQQASLQTYLSSCYLYPIAHSQSQNLVG